MKTRPRPQAVAGEYLLSVEGVMAKTQIGKTLLLALVRDGKFPQPRKVNARVVRWRGSDVDAWIRELPVELKGAA